MQVLFGPGYRGIFVEIAEFANATDAVFAPFFSERERAEDRKISNRATLRRKRVGRWALKLLALSATASFSNRSEFAPLRPPTFPEHKDAATFLTASVSVANGEFSLNGPFLQNLQRKFRALSVSSRDANGRGTPPRCVADVDPFWRAQPATRFGYSISHSSDRVLVVQSETLGIGCDLTPCGCATSALRNLFFTEIERRLLIERAATFPFLADAIWALKEAAYKAARSPIPFAPREFEVRSIATPFAKREQNFEIAFAERILRPVRLEIINDVALTVVVANNCADKKRKVER